MKIRNLNIGTRLALGFGLVLVLLVMLALVSLSRLADMHKSLDKIINENNVAIQNLNNMRQAVMVSAVSVRNLSVMTSPEDVSIETKQIEAANAKYKQSASIVEKIITQDTGKALLAKIGEGQAAAAPGIEKTMSMALRQGDVIPTLISVVVPNQRKWLEAMDAMIAYQDRLAKATSEEAATAYARARMLTVALSGAALLLGALIAWYFTRSITAPLQNAAKLARRVADGDLTTQVEVGSMDETGQLLEALKDMNASLVRIVTEVRSGTDAINHASTEIADGNMHLSMRTEDQANSLQETACSMEELTSTVKHNADNADQANRLAASASEVAIRGGAVVSQVIDTMGSINASAKKIVDIISVIDGIAFQTNILALNAAVEAARAGEQGRGFAVVAAEVRTLAQRSASAAKEIKELINDSVRKVDAGAQLVDQAGSTMTEIVESVRKVTEIIGEIASASSEQTTGIEQINQSVMQIDDVTQQNAALVEEAAAAAKAMQERANSLSQLVHVFKLEHGAPTLTQQAHQTEVISTGSASRLPSSSRAIRHDKSPKLTQH